MLSNNFRRLQLLVSGEKFYMVYLVPVSLGSWPGTKLSLVLKEICISIETLNKQNGNRYNINFEQTRCKVSRIYKNKKIGHCPRTFPYDIWITHNLFYRFSFFFRFVAVGYKTSIIIAFLRFYHIFIYFFRTEIHEKPEEVAFCL